MTQQEEKIEFDNMVKELEELLFTKGKEYSTEKDVLDNFKKGEEIGVSSKQKLFIYLDKHLSSIKSYIKNNGVYSTESIDSRICDACNYLFLLRCLIKDETR